MTERTTCLVAGGGPAGMVLGLLLARAGLKVTVLEKHADFLRDFRGDTVHPSTLILLDELGLGEEFAKLPARYLSQVSLPVGGRFEKLADFDRLPGKHKRIAMVPQWDFLDLLADAAKQEASFTLRMSTEVTGLLRSGSKVTGVSYRTKDGTEGEIAADLTVAADGRTSILRADAGMRTQQWTTPMDVWWFRLPRKESDPAGAVGTISRHRAAFMFDRGDYWQSATLIQKGSDAELRKQPVGSLVKDLAELNPWLADRMDALRSWDEVKLLDVKLDRVRRWYVDGLLLIGDAAHAMSPIGGVGINLAVQDAVAAARILAEPLRHGRPSTADLAKVQRRRIVPTVLTQGVQRLLHRKVLEPTLSGEVEVARAARLPLPLRVGRRIPVLRNVPPYLLAHGVLPEHAPKFARR